VKYAEELGVKKMPTCSCGASIEHIKLPSGKTTPVDVSPFYVVNRAKLGRTIIVTDSGEIVRGLKIDERPKINEKLFAEYEKNPEFAIGRRSHFETCPDAKKFRRR